MAAATASEGILSGLTVVEIGGEMATPIAGMLFADNGAAVIKVEPPGGDPYRVLPGARVWHRGKRSVTLDLDQPADRARLDPLLARAGVVITGLPPARLRSLRLDGPALEAAYPRLVAVNITGYGLEGRDSDRPGYDALVSAHIGFQHQQQGPRDGPKYLGFATASYSSALLGVLGATMALYLRGSSGPGRSVDVSLKDGALAFMTMEWARVAGLPTIAGSPYKKRLLVRSFECAGGEWLHLHTGAGGAFPRLMTALGLAEYAERPFAGESEWEEMVDRVAALFLTNTRQHWLAVLDHADVPNLPILRHGEVLHDEQARVMGFTTTVHDPELGDLLEVGFPLIFEHAQASVRSSWPKPGEHTAEVLGETVAPRPATPPAPRAAAGGPPIEGLKVVDFGHFFAGPYASRLLADLGANVVKVETTSGDLLRRTARAFNGAQRGKRAIAVDLKTDEGQRVARQLLAWADVVQHNLRPGVAERLGIDYATAKAANPRIVYLYSPGYGTRGPRVNQGSFEPLVSGLVGIQDVSSGEGNPPVVSQGNMDYGNAMLGACGVMMALALRDRTGESQYIECAQMSSGMLCTSEAYWLPGGTLAPQLRLDPGQYGIAPLLRLYETRDGHVCVSCYTEGEWRALAGALALPTLAEDPRFATHEARLGNAAVLVDALAARFRERTSAGWEAVLSAAGVPCEVPLANGAGRFLDDPESVRRGWVADYEHPAWGAMREIGQLIRLSGATSQITVPPPTLGQHSREILAMLGYPAAEVDRLEAAGIIRTTLETGAVL